MHGTDVILICLFCIILLRTSSLSTHKFCKPVDFKKSTLLEFITSISCLEVAEYLLYNNTEKFDSI